MGRIEEACEEYEVINARKDSLDANSYLRQINELHTLYQIDKNELNNINRQKKTQLYTLLYQRLCIMIGYTNNNEFTPRLTFAHRTYSLDLAERNTKCATISVYLADIASLKIICINWYCF